MANKFKLSTPTLLIIVAAVGAGAYIITSGSSSAPTKVTKRPLRAAVSKNGDDLITPADLKASFAAYKGPRHDAFLPLVTSGPQIGTLNGNGGVGGRGVWTLTGITTINGQESALVENLVKGVSDTLRVGDKWNDHRVVRISDSSVFLTNAQGQQTELTFPPPVDPAKKEDLAPIAEAEPEPAAAQPTIIQPNITIQAPTAAPGGGGAQGFQGGGQFPFGAFGGNGGGFGGNGGFGGPGGPGGPGGDNNN